MRFARRVASDRTSREDMHARRTNVGRRARDKTRASGRAKASARSHTVKRKCRVVRDRVRKELRKTLCFYLRSRRRSETVHLQDKRLTRVRRIASRALRQKSLVIPSRVVIIPESRTPRSFPLILRNRWDAPSGRTSRCPIPASHPPPPSYSNHAPARNHVPGRCTCRGRLRTPCSPWGPRRRW